MENLFIRVKSIEKERDWGVLSERDRTELRKSLRVDELQKNVFEEYRQNPVLYDAVSGRRSIEESAKELAQIRRHFKALLPWRKNNSHNERAEQIQELIYTPELTTHGILVPDNVLNQLLYVSGTLWAMDEVVSQYFGEGRVNLEMFGVGALIGGLGIVLFNMIPGKGTRYNAWRANVPEMVAEAKYLDTKVKELYR